MKTLISIALLTAAVATPALADIVPAKASSGKPAAAMPSASGHSHNMPGMMKGDCDAKHEMDCQHADKMQGMEDDCDSKHKAGGHHAQQGMEDDCDSRHGMGGHQGGMGERRGYGMMGAQQSADMMMEPNMHMLDALSLSEEQRAKINKLADELKHDNWATQGLINDETAKLRDLYEADKRDPAAIGKEYQKVFDLKRQMIETYLDIQNRIEAILTPEQLAKMKEARRKMHGMYGRHM